MTADGSGLEFRARSYRGRQWRLPVIDRGQVATMMSDGIPPLVAAVLAARGMSREAARAFFEPTLKELLPNPSFFNDMDEAAERLAKAVRTGEHIAIWGDYDVDGATSSAVLARFLRACGVEATIYIPDRMKEGYGPNAPGLVRLREEGVDLVVVVDSGTVAFEPLKAAKAAGLDVVVIDHHAAETEIPPAIAVVNPNRLDQAPGYGYICAAGMAFLLAVAVNARLRDSGFYAGRATKPELMSLLDVVALGTVADVVPLVGVNRAFVRRGLEVMSQRTNPGLAALCEVADLKGRIEAYHCGFVLGPRINAGGRVGQADTGARLLSSDDPALCVDLAQRLDGWNRERQEIERACLEEAKRQVAEGPLAGLCMAYAEGWHEGVVGIVAARLKEAHDLPSFVFSVHDGLAKGSGRSVKGFDMGRAVIAARQEGMLLKGGGHAMAAGVTLEAAKLDAFKAYVDAEIAKSEFGRTGVVADIDIVIPADRISVGLVDELAHMEPFGQGNPQPRFMIPGVRVAEASVLKGVHLRLDLENPAAPGRRLKALLFNAINTPLGDRLAASAGACLDVVGTLKINEWNNTRSAQLMIEDARLAEVEAAAA